MGREMSSSILMLLDYIEKVIAELDVGIRKRSLRKTRTEVEKLTVFSNCLKSELPLKISNLRNAEKKLQSLKNLSE